MVNVMPTGRFIPRKRLRGLCFIGVYAGPRTFIFGEVERKFPTSLPGFKTQPPAAVFRYIKMSVGLTGGTH